MKKVFALMGYNNTRIDDVTTIREKAHLYFDADILLCKSHITEADKKVCKYTLDISLGLDHQNVTVILNYCNYNALNIIGVLPFSDVGNLLASLLASELGLLGSNHNLIMAALDKLQFRKNESIIENLDFYHKSNFYPINTIDDIVYLFKEQPNKKLFIKPRGEGNSRGCTVIDGIDDINRAWDTVSKYLEGGVIAEEYFENLQEYSCDSVGGRTWITEKTTSRGRYSVEVQQIVPAILDNRAAMIIKQAGKVMSICCGANSLCYHNELFLDRANNLAIPIEPNIRPAGMKIWDLAKLAFQDFDPWLIWLESSTRLLDETELRQTSFAGIRMITARSSGRITHLSNITDPVIHEFKWTKKVNDIVTQNPKDNSDFLGFFIIKSNDYYNLKKQLIIMEEKISLSVSIEA